MQRSALVFVATFLFVTDLSQAFACSCIMPRPPGEELANATAVFSGTVTAQDERQGLSMRSADPVKVTFVVAEVWKGDIPAEVSITTARESASCGYNFEDGAEYLVYANGTDADRKVSLCSRTTLLANADEDLEALGAGSPPKMIPAANTGTALHPLAIYAISTIGFLLFAAVVYFVQRPKQTKS